MDPLSDVLQSARFHGARFLNAALGAPWCLDCREGGAGLGEGLAIAADPCVHRRS